MGATIALSCQSGQPWALRGGSGNPLTAIYRTSDERFLSLVMLQGFHYWPDFCRHIDREDLIEDSRFNSVETFSENAGQAGDILREEFAKRTLAQWTERFQTLRGQWAPVQNTVEVAADPQVRANGYITGGTTKDGIDFGLVSNPVQFDERPSGTARAPEFNEHCEEILEEIGVEMDRVIELKVAGVIS